MLSQSFKDFEFIIANDGSTDRTAEVLEGYAKKDRRIKVLQQNNIGLTETLNRLIKASKGEFIARQDADDISMPERLEKEIKRLRGDEDCLMAGCWFRTTFDNPGLSYDTVFPDNPGLLKRHLHRGTNCYAHGSVMIRKRVFDSMGLSYRFRYGQDLDLWLRLSEAGKLGMVEEVLYERRDNAQTLSNALVPRRRALAGLMLRLSKERIKEGQEITDWRPTEELIFKEVPLWSNKEIRAYDDFIRARALLLSGRSREARLALKSIKHDLKGLGGISSVYLLSHVPGVITGPALRLRDSIKDKKQFRRKVQDTE
jgi:glycosyltransferase involved in cell wall biosynthesis